MQLRRNVPLIVLLLIVILFAGLYGLSYVYTPAPTQTQMSQDVAIDKLAPAQESQQPAEYP